MIEEVTETKAAITPQPSLMNDLEIDSLIMTVEDLVKTLVTRGQPVTAIDG